ncbi:MAG: hypothetical protein ACPG32_15700 [Akkermansiaceae bacterium]
MPDSTVTPPSDGHTGSAMRHLPYSQLGEVIQLFDYGKAVSVTISGTIGLSLSSHATWDKEIVS